MTRTPVRQLSAIMFADISGYTAMMQRSEASAMASRDRFRDVLQQAVTEHDGTIVQHYGDGTLTIFTSAVEATVCALVIQKTLNAAPHVPLRIGLHIGDIVRDEEGVYGDGVNLAARVQALALPGSILVSERVAEEVRNHEGLTLLHLGSHHLKHVARPVGVLAVVDDAIVVPRALDRGSTASSHCSVAVLPFVNMSADPAQDFFSDGISEEIINSLAQIPELKVTSRTSSFAFRETNIDVREIARTLDVGHVLEGSVRTSGKSVRVTAQLIEAQSGFHVFSRRWDRTLVDVFAIQDELSQAIATHLQVALRGETDQTPSLPQRPTPRPGAYTLYLEGRHHWRSWTPEGAFRSIELYRDALDVDPDLAVAHAGIASSYIFLGGLGRLSGEAAYGKAKASALEALSIQPDLAEAEAALGLTALLYEWDREAADAHLQKALALGPGSASLHHFRGLCNWVLRRHALAIAEMEVAVELDPLSPAIHNDLARALLTSGQPEQALIQIERTLKLDPTFRSALELKSLAHWVLNDVDGAMDAMLEYRSHSPSRYAGTSMLSYLRSRTGDDAGARAEHQRLEERERLEPETLLDVDFAVSHLGLGEYESAFDRLQHAIDSRSANVIFAWSMPIWREVADHPRFKAIGEQIGLWS